VATRREEALRLTRTSKWKGGRPWVLEDFVLGKGEPVEVGVPYPLKCRLPMPYCKDCRTIFEEKCSLRFE
jgi:hypothetical protein